MQNEMKACDNGTKGVDRGTRRLDSGSGEETYMTLGTCNWTPDSDLEGTISESRRTSQNVF